MKAEIIIPKGYEQIPTDRVACIGHEKTYCLDVHTDGIKVIMEWQPFTDMHIVKKGEIFIRRE